MAGSQPKVLGGRYELTTPISSGGMGQVWRGYDTVLDRDIAVKLIRPDLARDDDTRTELVGRFRREARVTAKIDHPGVPAVYDAEFDAEADRLYLVMQLVHGVSLADVLGEHGAQPVEWAASLAAQVCAALSYAHAVPVVHRDLKPGNVMITDGGDVKVLDFGVAAVLRSNVTRLTATGDIVGTKPYMSPEQIQNAPPSPRSDLYALGCLLHELIDAGRGTQAAETLAEILPGVTDSSQAMDLRGVRAAALFLAGDFRRALPEFDSLAMAHARVSGAESEQALECRRQAAYCRMELGDLSEALAEMRSVLVGYRDRGQERDPDILELRRTIARLQVATGQSHHAGEALPALYDDTRAVLGDGDPLVEEVAEMVERFGPPS